MCVFHIIINTSITRLIDINLWSNYTGMNREQAISNKLCRKRQKLVNVVTANCNYTCTDVTVTMTIVSACLKWASPKRLDVFHFCIWWWFNKITSGLQMIELNRKSQPNILRKPQQVQEDAIDNTLNLTRANAKKD